MSEPRLEKRQDFYPDGSLEAERSVRVEADGSEVNHGTYTRWHQNGVKAEEGQYEDGVRVGRWRSWLESGRNFFDGDYLPEPPPQEVPEAPPPRRLSAMERFAGLPVTGPARRTLVLEVAAVLAVFWLPALVSASTLLAQGDTPVGSPLLSEINQAASSFGACAFLAFVVWKSGEGFAAFGLGRPRIIVDLVLGFIGFLILFEIYVRALTHFYGLYEVPTTPLEEPASPTGLELSVLALALLLNSLAEELAMRGYLMRRLGRLTQSWFVALVAPALLFGCYHMYGGVGHVLVTSLMGLGFGLLYWFTGRLWPGIVCHTLYNMTLYAVDFGFIEWT
ncbi:CPBP family intramembrane metalloprotease [bacterium]|nr:MAG: CPBP family intramembrane metalloprotease [bacterium]RIK61086.1 MAG: hypothetical protein DCC64_13805 [Planctomycetota bacterium]